MKTSDLEVGKPYLLRGGAVLRYRGLYDDRGPALAFCGVRVTNTQPTGCPRLQPVMVMQEITKLDIPWLRKRRGEAQERNDHEEVADMDCVIAEVS